MAGDQLDLFAGAPPYQRHSDTSRAAAEAVAPNAGTLRRKLLDFLAGRGGTGATDEESQDALQMPPSTQRPRRVELQQAGLVRDSGRRRKVRSGREAVVWVAAGGNAG